jgi:hypothetical protein
VIAALGAEKANPMKPPLPRIESAVPRTLHAQLEIAKAVRTLTAPNGDDPLRQRRAEIAAIRQDLEAVAREIPRAFKEASALVKGELRAALAKKYNPDQPRVSAGNRDGGQWTSGDEGGSETSPNHSDDGANETRSSPIRYAQASANTATDAPSGGSSVMIMTPEDTQHDLSNLYHAVVTAAHSLLGSAFRYFFDSRYFDIKGLGRTKSRWVILTNRCLSWIAMVIRWLLTEIPCYVRPTSRQSCMRSRDFQSDPGSMILIEICRTSPKIPRP